MIRQEMGSDPASVAYDTLRSAVANGADVVLIDTAGRLHNKVGLMNELTKIRNVMAKGGVVIGISDQFRIPVRYIGVGERIDQLQLFDRRAFVEALFGDETK